MGPLRRAAAGPSHTLAPAAVLALDAPHMRAAGPVGAQGRVPAATWREHFDSGRGARRANGSEMDDEAIIEELVAHPRHRPLDRRDVPDLPPDAARTCCRSTTSVCSRASASTTSAASRCRAPRRAKSAMPGRRSARSPLGTFGAASTRCRSPIDELRRGPLDARMTAMSKTTLPRLRAADRRARSEDRRAALRAERVGGRHLRRDRPPGQEEPAAHQGHLLEPDALAGDADRAPPAASVHARLRERDLHRLPRAARRPHLRRRPVDRRRPGALQRPGLHGASATRRAATPRSAPRATSACRGPRATARRCA